MFNWNDKTQICRNENFKIKKTTEKWEFRFISGDQLSDSGLFINNFRF